MARERSIPKHLEASILNRWVLGDSPQKIADWIAAGNRNRVTPVETSRASVERLIARHASTSGERATIATVHRLQRQAPAQVEVLERIEARYLELAKEADTLAVDGTTLPAVRLRCAERARYLGRAEQSAARMIRLAGLGGAQTHKVLDRYADVTFTATQGLEQELAQERFVEDAEASLEETLGGRSEAEVIEEMIRLQRAAAAASEQPSGEKAPRLNEENAFRTSVIGSRSPDFVGTSPGETVDRNAEPRVESGGTWPDGASGSVGQTFHRPPSPRWSGVGVNSATAVLPRDPLAPSGQVPPDSTRGSEPCEGTAGGDVANEAPPQPVAALPRPSRRRRPTPSGFGTPVSV